jgi:rhomboid protease GluP
VIYELALISVLIGAGYWGWFFVRRPPNGSLAFGAMQIAAAVLSGLGLVGREYDIAGLGVAGAIGVGAGACLLVIGPFVRGVARRLVAAERPGLALRLFDLVELLVPGTGVAEEKAMVRAMTEIREGRIEQTIDALTEAKQRATADAQLAIDERITMLYLTASRWTEAVAYAEAHLSGAIAGEARPAGGGELRQALGIAPPVWVELLGAYGRSGDLERAAHMLARLEDACAGRDDAALWVHRARVLWFALAGRIDAVRALVAPRRARHMARSARAYWIAVALEHTGDRAAAIAAYRKAGARVRGRSRALVDGALARLAEAAPPPAPALSADTRALIARIEAVPLPGPVRVARRPGPRATWSLAAILVGVAGVTVATVGETHDIGVLIRTGALLHQFVHDGEWWRVIACVFLHMGTLHLVLNVMGLIVLGRLTEDMFGPAKLIAIFAVSGIAGALASYAAVAGGMTAGASGAVFGLLGAVFIELTRHRRRYRAAWKGGMWGALVVVAVGQLGYGFLYPVIDQWAHGAGLAAGVAFGVVLSPHARWPRAARWLGRALAIGFAALSVASAVLVVRTSLVDSFDRAPRARFVLGGVAVTAPADWHTERGDDGAPGAKPPMFPTAGELGQPDGVIVAKLSRVPAVNPAAQIALWVASEGRHAKDDFGEIANSRAPLVALPAGWSGVELTAALTDELDDHQRMRVIVCGRAVGDTLVLMAIQVPETVASAAPAFVAALIASTGPA